jgi:hypothetical protein
MRGAINHRIACTVSILPAKFLHLPRLALAQLHFMPGFLSRDAMHGLSDTNSIQDTASHPGYYL